MITACQCKEPGYCKRHGCNKSPHLHTLCQTREDYFQLWEQGRGPGQTKPMPNLAQQAKNFVGSMRDFVVSGMKLSDVNEINRRLAICEICEHRSGNRCSICACNTNLKSRGLAFQCPLNKWEASGRTWLVPTVSQLEQKWASAYAAGSDDPEYLHPAPWRYVSTAELIQATVNMLPKLPKRISGVAGRPRSGMIPASVLATMLHVPLYELSADHGLRRCGNGWRGEKHLGTDGPIVVIDDTIYSGLSMTEAMRIMGSREALYAAVYIRPSKAGIVDVYGEILPSPHLLEWNLWNSSMLGGYCANESFKGGIATDLDGVLAEECPVDGDDTSDGDERYRQWLTSAKALMTAQLLPIPLIVSYRLERYRTETEQWLSANRISYDRLILHPATTFSGRDFNSARYKGGAYAESGCSLFVESSDLQAQAIFAYTKRPVLSMETKRIYQK